MVMYWREFVTLTDELFDRHRIRTIKVDNSAGNWDDCNQQVLDCLAISLVRELRVSPSDAARLVGLYKDRRTDREFTVQYEDGGLTINVFLGVRTKLVPRADKVFLTEGWHFSSIQFQSPGFSCGCLGRGLWPQWPLPSGGRKQYTTKRGLNLFNAMHITASVYINDDERGLLADYEEWLEELAPHGPISRYHHNRTGEDNGDAASSRSATCLTLQNRAVHCAFVLSKRSTDSMCSLTFCRGGGDHRRLARFRAVGADLLRGVRR
jgi:hypothetical protein